MRRAVAVVLLLLAPLASGPFAAAEPVASGLRIVDPATDVMIRLVYGTNVTKSPTDEHIDLRSVWLTNETETTFEMGVALGEWDDPNGQVPDAQRWISLSFRFGANTYSAIYGRTVGSTFGGKCAAGQAQFGPSSGGDHAYVTHLGCLNATVEPEKASVHVVFEKRLVADHGQLPLAVGSTLDDVHVVAGYYIGYAAEAVDRAPDAGKGPTYVLKEGELERSGHLVLYTPLPVRASNGESTTMVFPLDVRNEATSEDRVLLRADNPNPDWTVRLPASVVVPAQGSVRIPLILSMNFTHLHGETILMPVRAESTHAPGAYATLLVGVHWLDIPQPAGHHDRFWLHSFVRPFGPYPAGTITTSDVWFNALETDPRPHANDVAVRGTTGINAWGDIVWEMPLDPALQIGLDMDASREGRIVFQTRHTLASAATTLEAELIHCGRVIGGQGPDANECFWRQNMTVLAKGRSAARTIAPSSVAAWEIPLKVEGANAFLPFTPSSNVQLRIRLHEDVPHTIFEGMAWPTPELVVKGASLQLPLREYHDPIDQSFERVGTIRLRALDPLEKPANPGRSAVFRYEVQNSGEKPLSARLFVEGINQAWANLPDGERLTLGAGETRTVNVVVHVPDDAAEGERAELFFVVEDKDAPQVAALARLRVAVINPASKEIADEAIADTMDDEGSAPVPGALALFALAIGSMMLARRRSR